QWHVPKRELVGTVQSLIQCERLKVAARIPEPETLLAELHTFRVRLTEAANESYGAWREGEHDDTVLARCPGLLGRRTRDHPADAAALKAGWSNCAGRPRASILGGGRAAPDGRHPRPRSAAARPAVPGRSSWGRCRGGGR